MSTYRCQSHCRRASSRCIPSKARARRPCCRACSTSDFGAAGAGGHAIGSSCMRPTAKDVRGLLVLCPGIAGTTDSPVLIPWLRAGGRAERLRCSAVVWNRRGHSADLPPPPNGSSWNDSADGLLVVSASCSRIGHELEELPCLTKKSMPHGRSLRRTREPSASLRSFDTACRAAERNSKVTIAATPRGGHLGWVDGTTEGWGHRVAAEFVDALLAEVVSLLCLRQLHGRSCFVLAKSSNGKQVLASFSVAVSLFFT
jgi:hypothetical protein